MQVYSTAKIHYTTITMNKKRRSLFYIKIEHIIITLVSGIVARTVISILAHLIFIFWYFSDLTCIKTSWNLNLFSSLLLVIHLHYIFMYSALCKFVKLLICVRLPGEDDIEMLLIFIKRWPIKHLGDISNHFIQFG